MDINHDSLYINTPNNLNTTDDSNCINSQLANNNNNNLQSTIFLNLNENIPSTSFTPVIVSYNEPATIVDIELKNLLIKWNLEHLFNHLKGNSK